MPYPEPGAELAFKKFSLQKQTKNTKKKRAPHPPFLSKSPFTAIPARAQVSRGRRNDLQCSSSLPTGCYERPVLA